MSDRLIGQVINISSEGLAFRYVDKEVEEDVIQKIMLITDGTFFLTNIEAKTVNDFSTDSELYDSEIKIRQRCVKYGNMTKPERDKLTEFILANGSLLL